MPFCPTGDRSDTVPIGESRLLPPGGDRRGWCLQANVLLVVSIFAVTKVQPKRVEGGNSARSEPCRRAAPRGRQAVCRNHQETGVSTMAAPPPETLFTRDILGRYVCNTFAEAQ